MPNNIENNLEMNKGDIIKQIQDSSIREMVYNFIEKDVRYFNEKFKDLDKYIRKSHRPDKACNQLFKYMDRLLRSAQKIEIKVKNKIVLKSIKQVFRGSIKDFINKSLLMRRAYYKLAGHPGDFKTIEMFYDNIPISKGIGYCGDRYILQDGYVKAVRIRKDIARNKLKNFIKNKKVQNLKIMNLGCGSCREIKELFLEYKINIDTNIVFTLIDWDKKALQFAEKELAKCSSKGNIKFIFIHENILSLYKYPEKYYEKLSGQDLIYSIGLVDYLPDIILSKMIEFCFQLLRNDGNIIIAHKNIKKYQSFASDWACDWSFYPRNREDVKEVIDDALKDQSFGISINSEKTNRIFFIDIKKNAI